jgi:hypothetical protein
MTMSQNNLQSTRLQNFAALSAILTGFQSSVINPLLDPIHLKRLYLDTADQEAGAALVDQLLAQFLSLQGQPAQRIANTLLAITGGAGDTAPQTALVARSILKLWYLGSWFPAASADAYIGGLAWRAAQAHPMAYSQFTFGDWASPPPSAP